MVRVEGKLHPLRITKEDLVKLVTQLDEKLPIPSMPSNVAVITEIDITIGRYSETCNGIDQLAVFLSDIRLPKVTCEFSLQISKLRYRVHIFFFSSTATYTVDGAKDVAEARSIEDIVIQFQKRHGAPRILGGVSGFGVGIGLVILFELALGLSVRGGWSASTQRVLFVTDLCLIASLAYIVWSYFTDEPPPSSFHHAILYMEKEPKNNIFWVLVSTILVAVVGAVIFSFI